MRVFLCLGNQKIENEIKKLKMNIINTSSDLKKAIHTLDDFDVDIIIVNRLLDDTDGFDLISIADEAKSRKIKIIILTNNIEDPNEKKLISTLVSREVNVFLKFGEIQDKLQDAIDNYPSEFSFDMFSMEGNREENEKIFSVEKRIEVKKEIKIREIDKCVIAIISVNSNGKTFLSWNLEKMFNENEYNTAMVSVDGTAKYLYGIEDDIKDFAVELADDRTVYLNTSSGNLNGKTLESILNTCRVKHDIIIIDSNGNKDNIYKAVSLSNKVITIFNLTEYDIWEDLKMLKNIINIFNKNDIIAVINNYVKSSTAEQLKYTLENMGINNIITISNVPGENVYDLVGTSYIPADKNIKLKSELQVLLKCLKAREGVKHKSLKKYIRKELKVLKYALKEYSKNKNTAKILKIAVFLFIIALIMIFLNNKGINLFQIIDEIKNYFGGNE